MKKTTQKKPQAKSQGLTKKKVLMYGGIALGVAALANVAIFRKAILPVVIGLVSNRLQRA